MTEPDDTQSDLGPAEHELARQLNEQRPVLAARDPGYGPRPARLRFMVFGYVVGGVALMALGTLLATGAV